MARKPKKVAAQDTGLLAALKFVQVAQQEVGTPYQTHCRFTQLNGTNYVVAFNGIIAAGHPVAEELPACPHTYRLIDALERVGGAMSMTALDNKTVVVKSDKFRAVVSAHGDGDLTYSWPDAPQWPLTDAFKGAADLAAIFTTEGAQTVMAAAVVTRGKSIVGTNGKAIVEAWHGIDMPPGLIIPKSFITAVLKVPKPLIKFGFSQQSFTVFFEDYSWLKTQLYQEQYPNIDMVLAWTETANPMPLAKDIIEGIKAVEPFAETVEVFLGNGAVRSHHDPELGATAVAKSATVECSVNAQFMLALADVIQQIDYTGNEKVITWFGENVRGAFSQFAKPKYNNPDDEIPF